MPLSKKTKTFLGHTYATAAGLAIPATVGTLGMNSEPGGLKLAILATMATTVVGGLEILAKSDRAQCLNFMGSAVLSLCLFMAYGNAPEKPVAPNPATPAAVKPAVKPGL